MQWSTAIEKCNQLQSCCPGIVQSDGMRSLKMCSIGSIMQTFGVFKYSVSLEVIYLGNRFPSFCDWMVLHPESVPTENDGILLQHVVRAHWLTALLPHSGLIPCTFQHWLVVLELPSSSVLLS